MIGQIRKVINPLKINSIFAGLAVIIWDNSAAVSTIRKPTYIRSALNEFPYFIGVRGLHFGGSLNTQKNVIIKLVLNV